MLVPFFSTEQQTNETMNKLEKRRKVTSTTTFEFSTLYTKLHIINFLLQVLV